MRRQGITRFEAIPAFKICERILANLVTGKEGVPWYYSGSAHEESGCRITLPKVMMLPEKKAAQTLFGEDPRSVSLD